jgi:opacity protein-like surface antigen
VVGPGLLVVSGEIALSYARVEARTEGTNGVGTHIEQTDAVENPRGFVARVSYRALGQTELFLSAGLARARIDSDRVGNDALGNAHGGGTASGRSLGAGVQVELGKNSFLRGEYTVTRYAGVDRYNADNRRNNPTTRSVVAALGRTF